MEEVVLLDCRLQVRGETALRAVLELLKFEKRGLQAQRWITSNTFIQLFLLDFDGDPRVQNVERRVRWITRQGVRVPNRTMED